MTDNAQLVQSAEELEKVLEDPQQIETFDPPAGVRERGRLTDESVYEQADRTVVQTLQAKAAPRTRAT